MINSGVGLILLVGAVWAQKLGSPDYVYTYTQTEVEVKKPKPEKSELPYIEELNCITELYNNAQFNNSAFDLNLIYNVDTQRSHLRLTRKGNSQIFDSWANIIFNVSDVISYKIKPTKSAYGTHDNIIAGWTSNKDLSEVSGYMGSRTYSRGIGKRSA